MPSTSRSIDRPVSWSALQSPILLTGTIAAFLIHLGAMYFPPAQAVLGTAPVRLEQWLVLGAVALTIAVAIELHKLSWKARYPPHSETEGLSSSKAHEKEVWGSKAD